MKDQKNIAAHHQQLKKDLSAVFKGCPAIRSAYLFGTAAMGQTHPKSDVDIAIRCLPELSIMSLNPFSEPSDMHDNEVIENY